MFKVTWSPRLSVALIVFAINALFLLLTWSLGFNLWFYIPVALITLALSILYPSGALMAALLLTIIFAKQYTLQPMMIGSFEVKLFLLDLPLLGAAIGLLSRHWPIKSFKIPMKADWLLLSFIVLVGIYTLSSFVFWQGQPNLVISSLKNYGFYPLVFFAVYLAFDSQEKWKELFTVALWAVLASLAFVFYGLINGQGLWTEITPLTTTGSRLLDFDHAFYLSLATVAGLTGLVYVRSFKLRRFWALVLPLFLIGVAGSLMRHLWLAMAATAGFFFWQVAKTKKAAAKKILLGASLVAVLAVLGSLLLVKMVPDSPLSQRMSLSTESLVTRVRSIADSSDTSTSWRLYVWKSLWQEYKENAFFGLGFGQKVFIQMPYYSSEVEVRDIHNSFLAVIAQMGIIPSVILLWFFWEMLAAAIKSSANGRRPLSVCFASMMVLCFIVFNFQPYLEANFFNFPFWFLMGLARRSYEGFTS